MVFRCHHARRVAVLSMFLSVVGFSPAGMASDPYFDFFHDEEAQRISQEAEQEHQAARELVEALKKHPVHKQKKTVASLVPSALTPAVHEALLADLPGDVAPHVRMDIYRTAINYMNGITMTTSPILGLRSAWNTSDLLYQISSMNEDLRLLQYQDDFNNVLQSLGSSLDTRPLLVFSGGVETTMSYGKNYTNTNSVDVSLSSAEIDVWAILSQWASAFVTIDFDDSPPQTGSRVANSRLFLQRGFLTIGNLQTSPFYFTAGQLFTPFGRYSSAMVTTPITTSIAKTAARAVVLGYYSKGVYAEIYGDDGNRVSTDSNDLIFQGGGNLGYKGSIMPWPDMYFDVDVGTGYTSNIADSQGMQANGLTSNGVPATQFAGFGNTINADDLSANNLKHNVGAVDFHLSLSRGIATLITEYITAVQRFDAGDLMYNGEGALVQALQTELDFNLKWQHLPITVGGAYNRSWQSLALNVPQQSYVAMVSTSFWKNTVESLEYRHDINYPVTDNVGGGGSGDEDLVVPVTSANVGGSQDLVTLKIGAYF